jgi:putative SOS response-associated peptidase YedK
VPAHVLAKLFGLQRVGELLPRYNIAPSQLAPVIRMARGTGERTLDMLQWGLIPSWADDPKIGNRMINARAESAASKPAFRAAFKRQRCLIPVEGFFEWEKTAKGKQPYFIHMRNGEPFTLAGLWEQWRDPQGTDVSTFTVLTTQANELTTKLHDRMPVIIERADYDRWLDPAQEDPQLLQELLKPAPAQEMTMHPVSRKVNTPAQDEADCIEPITLESKSSKSKRSGNDQPTLF